MELTANEKRESVETAIKNSRALALKMNSFAEGNGYFPVELVMASFSIVGAAAVGNRDMLRLVVEVARPALENANIDLVFKDQGEQKPTKSQELGTLAQLIERLAEAENALEWYADENGGPYAPGDHHSADGGKRAREYFEKWRTSAEGE